MNNKFYIWDVDDQAWIAYDWATTQSLNHAKEFLLKEDAERFIKENKLKDCRILQLVS